ncbi:MAG: hypothetical protein PWQ92_342 [Thermococcaceae archaeon]|jgi:hypothetical protein|nr:hypothetical protein [Thermococcaceae archaeon]
MKRLLALLVGLLTVGATAGIVQAANTPKIPEVRVHILNVQGKPVKIIEKDGVISIVNAEGVNKRILIEQVRKQISMKHMKDITSKNEISPLALYVRIKSDADGNQRLIILPTVGEIYIGAYAEETVRREVYFSGDYVLVEGYTDATSWRELDEVYWEGYNADEISMEVGITFYTDKLNADITISYPPGFTLSTQHDSSTIRKTFHAYDTDYLGYDFGSGSREIHAETHDGSRIYKVSNNVNNDFYFEINHTWYGVGATASVSF